MDESKSPVPMKPFGRIAQAEFERARAERAKIQQASDPGPVCQRCFGTDWEEYIENGYKQVRRCDHVIADDDDSDVDNW